MNFSFAAMILSSHMIVVEREYPSSNVLFRVVMAVSFKAIYNFTDGGCMLFVRMDII